MNTKDDDFIKSSYGFKEITKTISQEDTEELISDLIYALTQILELKQEQDDRDAIDEIFKDN